MEKFHKIHSVDVDLVSAIANHSADTCTVYKAVDGQPLYLGIYYPKGYDRTGSYPTFIFIHGGAWCEKKVFDDQSFWQGDYLGFLARYYADRGFLCISIDYRLIKEQGQAENYGLIDSYEDCCDAIDFIQSQAANYGIDINRMYLLGESAGGHLAGAIATFRYDRRYNFETIFLINPITSLHDSKWKTRVPRKSNHNSLCNLTLHDRVEFLSPLYQADVHTSRVILIHGNADTCVSLEHSKAFYAKMLTLGKECTLHILDGVNHAFLLAEFTAELDACKLGISIINEYF